MAMNRKEFLSEGLLNLGAAAGAALIAPSLLKAAFAAPQAQTVQGADVLVVVFLRGAADGLNFVLPISGEDRSIYESERPTLAIPNSGPKGALKLDQRFGIHPSAQPLHELYHSGKLAIVHSAGLPVNSRSHFDAQELMELGTPQSKGTPAGWLTRHLEMTTRKGSASSILSAVSVGNLVPTSLLAYPHASVINQLGGLNLSAAKPWAADQLAALEKMYGAKNGWLTQYGQETLEAMHALENAKPGDYVPAHGADYPKSDISNRLKTLAQLIKMNLGLRVATIDMGGWDTHKYQGNGADGQFANLVGQLSQGLHAFYHDVSESLQGRLTILVMSEFGRRVKENASHGTDHGHGNMMMVLGDGIRGGKIYGDWPGLRTERLYERADLAVTTDFRQVISEILVHRLKNPKVSAVFPGFRTGKSLGLTES